VTTGQGADNDAGFSLTSLLAGELTAFAEPLIAAGHSEAAASALLANIGWQTSALPDLIAAVQQTATSIDAALTATEAFIDGSGRSETALGELKALLESGKAVAGAVSALSRVASADSPVQGLERLGEDLVAWLGDQYLRNTHPLAYGIARLLTLVTPQDQAPEQSGVVDANGQTLRVAYQLPSLDLDRLGGLLRNPQSFLRSAYIAGGSLATPDEVNALADALFPVVADALNAFGMGANYGLDSYFDELGLDAATSALLQRSLTIWLLDSDGSDASSLGATLALMGPDDSTNNQIAAVLAPVFPPDFAGGFLRGWDVSVQVGSGGGPLSVVGWSPYPANAGAGEIGLTVTLTLGQWTSASGTSAGVGGQPTLGAATAPGPGAHLSVEVSTTDTTFTAELGFAAQGTVTVNPADFADGFLGQVLPDQGISVPLSLSVTGSKQGWKLQASVSQNSAIVLASFPEVDLGPLAIEDGQLTITPQSTAVDLAVAFGATVSFGPLTATVEGLGLGLAVTWPAGGGNVGPFDLAPDIVWPTGAGVSIDAGPVTGGGFVSLDVARGQYSGDVELALESLALTAIGLIQTRNADGTPLLSGFSLLVIIDVTFVPPMELGFGFSLNGVGGLVGLNRTTNMDALRAGVRSGSIQDIMFPSDPVGHAAQIIEQLTGFLPAAPNRFLVGPMVEIEWGSPAPILKAELGVLVELPAPIRAVVLGVLTVGLPQADELALVQLNLDALGVIDFGAGSLSLDASLFDSRVVEFAITGDMALRIGWKQDTEFLLSIGGFHPAFTPPGWVPNAQPAGDQPIVGRQPPIQPGGVYRGDLKHASVRRQGPAGGHRGTGRVERNGLVRHADPSQPVRPSDRFRGVVDRDIRGPATARHHGAGPDQWTCTVADQRPGQDQSVVHLRKRELQRAARVGQPTSGTAPGAGHRPSSRRGRKRDELERASFDVCLDSFGKNFRQVGAIRQRSQDWQVDVAVVSPDQRGARISEQPPHVVAVEPPVGQ
jgi:hypothetical protein